MKRYQFTAFALIGFLVAFCSSDLKVSSDYDKSADFDSYSSFFFLPWDEENSKLINRLDQDRLFNAVKGQMIDRGYAYNEQGGDLAISLFLVLEQKSSTTAYSNHYGGYGYGGYYYSPGWGWGGGYASTRYSTYDYLKGTLVIDVLDTKTKQLVWQGVGSKTVDEDPDTREKTTPRVMEYMFRQFPKDKLKN